MNNLIKTPTRPEANLARMADAGPFLSPFRTLERMMDDVFAGFGMPLQLAMPTHVAFNPKLDITESDTAYHIAAELPGLTENDIHIEVKDKTLVLSGEKRSTHEDTQHGVYRMERSYGKFQRQFMLPEHVDRSKIDASFQHGVLNVVIPKKTDDKATSHTIPVKSVK